VKSRIVLTPQYAKRLLKAMGENIHRFEVAHGEIKTLNFWHQYRFNFGPAGQVYYFLKKAPEMGAFFD
jgi:hypothetical protein